MGKNAVVQKVFHGLKKVYLKLPVDKEAKIKAKNAFYKVFGPLFKNTPSYQQWAYIHAKSMKKGKVKISDAQLKKFTFSGKIAIQLHLFYVDLMDEFVKYFNHMPYPFDLYISVMDQSLENEVRRKAEKSGMFQRLRLSRWRTGEGTCPRLYPYSDRKCCNMTTAVMYTAKNHCLPEMSRWTGENIC